MANGSSYSRANTDMVFTASPFIAIKTRRAGGCGNSILAGLLDILFATTFAAHCCGVSGKAGVKVLLIDPNNVIFILGFVRKIFPHAAVIFSIDADTI